MKRDGGGGTRWGQAQLKLNLRDLLMQLSTLVSAVVALESAPASATLNRRCNGGGGVFRPRYGPVVELPTLKKRQPRAGQLFSWLALSTVVVRF